MSDANADRVLKLGIDRKDFGQKPLLQWLDCSLRGNL
jgi:hypothetical protein